MATSTRSSSSRVCKNCLTLTLRKKCPYSELLWSAFSRIGTEYREMRSISPYFRIQSKCGKIRTRITPNTDTVYPVLSFWETYTSFALTRSTSHQKMELDTLNQKIRLNCDTLRSDRRLCEAHWNIPDIQKTKALIPLFWKHKYYF